MKKLFVLPLVAFIATVGTNSVFAKSKCYGVAEAGQNDCGNGKHACKGYSKKDYDPTEWKYVSSEEECKKLKDQMAAEEK